MNLVLALIVVWWLKEREINAYFEKKNPGHANGDYLVCLGAFDAEFFALQLTVLSVGATWYARL